jgi:hypothetical protein
MEGIIKGVRGQTKFGIIADGEPFWQWGIGRSGTLVWTVMRAKQGEDEQPWEHPVGTQVLRVEERRDEIEALTRVSPVDVVLFEGIAPGLLHPVWSDSEVKLIAWFSVGTRGGSRTPRDWTTQHIVLRHNELGGVTDGVFHIFLSHRVGSKDPEIHPPVGLTTNLGHIVDTTVGGKRCAAPTLDEESRDTARGLLSWKNRFGYVRVPSVFTKTEWVRRKLATKEQMRVLDAPADVVARASGSAQERWSRVLTVPIKIRVEIMELVERAVERQQNRRDSAAWEFAEETTVAEGGAKKRETTEIEAATSVHKRSKTAEPEGTLKLAPAGNDEASISIQERRDGREAKALKADNAAVPEYLWDDRVARALPRALPTQDYRRVLWVLREASLRFWKRKVAVDFWTWWKGELEEARRTGREVPLRSLVVGSKALAHASDASWWDWDRGSAPFFWRWPKEFQLEIRDGMPPRFIDTPPTKQDPQRRPVNKDTARKEREKIDKFRLRESIAPSSTPIRALMNTFSVPKGDDLRMVFDASKSGLNRALWAPWFALPKVEAMTRTVGTKFWCADNDYGEMFYNWWLHDDLRPYCGIDLTQVYPEEARYKPKGVLWNIFTRPAMGLRPSPYQAVQGCLRAKRLMLGDHNSAGNVFQWSTVDLNIPGNPDYRPSDPWVSKRREDSRIAADIHTYVDDNRETAPTEELAWLASSQVAKMNSWLGLQDAARKRRPPAQKAGAWAGAVVHADGEQVFQLVTQERWDKTKRWVVWLQGHASMGSDAIIPHKELESARGFLVYVARTYGAMVPYLKGLHLTLDSWRPDRDEDGWRYAPNDPRWLEVEPPAKSQGVEDPIGEKGTKPRDPDDPPSGVKAVPRFAPDVEVLSRLTESREPPRVPVRPTVTATAWFCYGDASGQGFGFSLWISGTLDIDLSYGVWDQDTSEESSNFREFYNLVVRVETLHAQGKLGTGTELFIFTDNFVTECAFHKGTSRSKKLFGLVVRLRLLEMMGALFIRVIWVAGKRMIAQGTDGLSRGDLSNGVMAGDSMLSHVPLNQDAFSRSPKLGEWLQKCSDNHVWEVLGADGWFDRGHQDGNFIWVPPPAVADAALEQLCEARHTRPWNAHIFVCPLLMTSRWRKQLAKLADVMFVVPVGTSIWETDMYEPVLIAFICPLLNCRPWQVRKTPLVAQLNHSVSGVWSQNLARERSHLRKFWKDAREWDGVCEGVARPVLQAGV